MFTVFRSEYVHYQNFVKSWYFVVAECYGKQLGGCMCAAFYSAMQGAGVLYLGMVVVTSAATLTKFYIPNFASSNLKF